jgi:hypothetical protein
MGKKRSRDTYTSKGERRNVSKATTKLVRRTKPILETAHDKHLAEMKGKKTRPFIEGIAEYRKKFLNASSK